jgi:hypothetical protein
MVIYYRSSHIDVAHLLIKRREISPPRQVSRRGPGRSRRPGSQEAGEALGRSGRPGRPGRPGGPGRPGMTYTGTLIRGKPLLVVLFQTAPWCSTLHWRQHRVLCAYDQCRTLGPQRCSAVPILHYHDLPQIESPNRNCPSGPLGNACLSFLFIPFLYTGPRLPTTHAAYMHLCKWSSRSWITYLIQYI